MVSEAFSTLFSGEKQCEEEIGGMFFQAEQEVF